VDVGANIGLYTAIAAETVGPQRTVIAVELRGATRAHAARPCVEQFKNVEGGPGGGQRHDRAGQLFSTRENKADHRIFDRESSRAVGQWMFIGGRLLAKLAVRRVDA